MSVRPEEQIYRRLRSHGPASGVPMSAVVRALANRRLDDRTEEAVATPADARRPERGQPTLFDEGPP